MLEESRWKVEINGRVFRVENWSPGTFIPGKKKKGDDKRVSFTTLAGGEGYTRC